MTPRQREGQTKNQESLLIMRLNLSKMRAGLAIAIKSQGRFFVNNDLGGSRDESVGRRDTVLGKPFVRVRLPDVRGTSNVRERKRDADSR